MPEHVITASSALLNTLPPFPKPPSARARKSLLEHWSRHPLNWLYAEVDGRPLIWTKDEREARKGINPLKPFPTDRPYLARYIDTLHTSDMPVLVNKPRQVMVTWATVLYADWACLFQPVRQWLLSKSTETEAIDILDTKPRFVYALLPPWVQEAMPVKHSPKVLNTYYNTGSFFRAVPMNVAHRAARGGGASGVIVDEAARQVEFKEIWQAVGPAATKLICMTTAQVGNPGAEFFYELLQTNGGVLLGDDLEVRPEEDGE